MLCGLLAQLSPCRDMSFFKLINWNSNPAGKSKHISVRFAGNNFMFKSGVPFVKQNKDCI